MHFQRMDHLTDWSRAAEVLSRSWRENPDSGLAYTNEFIQSLAECPGDYPTLAPAYLDGSELAAFVMGFPRRVALHDQPLNLALLTFFTVAPEYKRRGLGRRIWADALREAVAAGYNGVLYYCAEGNISNEVTAAAADDADFEVFRVFPVGYYMRLLKAGDLNGEDVQISDPQTFLTAASLVRGPLRRIWTEREVRWLLNRTGGLTVSEPGVGVLSGYTIAAADAQQTPCAFLDDILWLSDSPEDRSKLLQRYLAAAARQATIVLLPALNYADLEDFVKHGFRKSRRLLHTYLAFPRGYCNAGPMQSIYIDVL